MDRARLLALSARACSAPSASAATSWTCRRRASQGAAPGAARPRRVLGLSGGRGGGRRRRRRTGTCCSRWWLVARGVARRGAPRALRARAASACPGPWPARRAVLPQRSMLLKGGYFCFPPQITGILRPGSARRGARQAQPSSRKSHWRHLGIHHTSVVVGFCRAKYTNGTDHASNRSSQRILSNFTGRSSSLFSKPHRLRWRAQHVGIALGRAQALGNAGGTRRRERGCWQVSSSTGGVRGRAHRRR